MQTYFNLYKVQLEVLLFSGFDIEASQVYRTRKVGDVVLEGNIDVEAIYTPPRGGHKRKVNIDIKYSGLLNEKWSKFGWQWSEIQTAYNAIQGIQYQLLNSRPTFFLVCSSTNNEDLELWEMKPSNDSIDAHVWRAREIELKIGSMQEMQVPWSNYPSLTKCSKCPLKTCPDRVNKLVPTKIEY